MENDDFAPSDLIYWTYYMMDWSKVTERSSETRCVSCGSRMSEIGAPTGRHTDRYIGLVCHACKSLFWLRTPARSPSIGD